MSKRDNIRSAISSLYAKIAEYNSNIDELNQAKSRLLLYCEDANYVSRVINKYDNTRNDRWLGNLNEEAYEVQINLSANISKGEKQTEDFIASIDHAIARLRDMISDCEDEIATLEIQLACCEEEIVV